MFSCLDYSVCKPRGGISKKTVIENLLTTCVTRVALPLCIQDMFEVASVPSALGAISYLLTFLQTQSAEAH